MTPSRLLRRAVPLLLLAVVATALPGVLLPVRASDSSVAGTGPLTVTDVPVPPRAAAPRVAVLASSDAGVLVAEEPLGRPETLTTHVVWLPVDGPPVRDRLYGDGPVALVGPFLVRRGPDGRLRAQRVDTPGSSRTLDGDPVSVGSTRILVDEGPHAAAHERVTVHSYTRETYAVRGLDGDLEPLSAPMVHDDTAVVSTTDPATGVRRAFAIHTPTATARRIATDMAIEDGTAVQGGDVLAWWSRETTGERTAPRFRVSRTTVVEGVPGAVTHSEPWQDDGSGELPAIVVSGGHILLSGRAHPLPARGEPDSVPRPLLRLQEDGRLRAVGFSAPVLAYPGARLVTSAEGRVVVMPAVTDDPARDAAMLWTPPPQQATAQGVALDGPRLFVTAADVRWWDPAALDASAPAPSGVLLDEVAWGLAVHRGGALVQLPHGRGLVATALPGHRPPGGQAGRELPGSDRLERSTGALSGDHHLWWSDIWDRPRLLRDLTDDSSTALTAPVALHDSVLWQAAENALLAPDLRRRGALPDLLVGRDLRTGATRTVATAPGCDPSQEHPSRTELQAAGRWLLARCSGGSWQLLDVLGERPPELLGAISNPRLGNGALLRTAPGDDKLLQWRALGVPHAAWRDLGAVQPPVTHPETLAVSSWGPTVSAAWVTPDGGVRHAVLPLRAVDPPPTTGSASPPPPVTGLSVRYPDDGAATASWRHPGGDHVLGHVVVVREAGALSPRSVTLLAPEARSTALDVSLGRLSSVEVLTVAPGGTAGPVEADVRTQLVRPGAPALLDLESDHVGDRTATVAWTQTLSRPAPTHFDVHVDGRLVATYPYAATLQAVDQHRASFATTAAGEYRVRVVARLDGWAESSEVTEHLPGPDLVAPRITSTTLPAVTLGTTARLSFTGADDRRIVNFQVRVRQAPAGQPLSTWQQPSAWSAMPVWSTGVTAQVAAGQTRCLQARARDAAGNWSAWSGARCVTRPVDDARLAASGRHTRQRASWAMSGTLTRLDARGALVRATGTRTSAVHLVVTRCPACGSVELLDDGVVFGRVDLRADSTQAQQVVSVPLGRSTRGGVISVRSTSTRPAYVDGLALRSY